MKTTKKQTSSNQSPKTAIGFRPMMMFSNQPPKVQTGYRTFRHEHWVVYRLRKEIEFWGSNGWGQLKHAYVFAGKTNMHLEDDERWAKVERKIEETVTFE